MHEVHGDGIVLAEATLPNEAAAGGRVHGSHGLHEALRISGHRRHFLRLQHSLPVLPLADGSAAVLRAAVRPRGRLFEAQRLGRWPLVGPQVFESGLLLYVVAEQALEDLLPYHLTVDLLLRLELPHLSCKVGEQVRLILRPEAEVEQILGPCQAVHRLLRCGPDGAVGVDLLRRLCLALEALGLPLFDHSHLPEVPGAARLEERLLRGEAQAVHVAARL
mmetsp:Transcript_36279/g.91363  ORF Transcript_36279/g.91363 Transcript_36279/m.91363 type:complete len:220 (+) Transcript_36279:808-1467(+)